MEQLCLTVKKNKNALLIVTLMKKMLPITRPSVKTFPFRQNNVLDLNTLFPEMEYVFVFKSFKITINNSTGGVL